MIHVLRASSSGSRSVPCTGPLTLLSSLRGFCIILSVWKTRLLIFYYVDFVLDDSIAQLFCAFGTSASVEERRLKFSYREDAARRILCVDSEDGELLHLTGHIL